MCFRMYKKNHQNEITSEKELHKYKDTYNKENIVLPNCNIVQQSYLIVVLSMYNTLPRTVKQLPENIFC